MEDFKLKQKELIPANAVLIEPLKETDWRIGGDSKLVYEVINETANWFEYEPTNERQNRGMETMICTNEAGNNSWEVQLIYMIEHNLLSPKALNFLNGDNIAKISYLDENNKPNFSDKWIAILSGTSPSGNWLYKTPEKAHEFGLIPESMLPFGNPKTWNDFFNKEQITQEMYDLGEEFKEIFEIEYEAFVTSGKTKAQTMEEVDKHLKQAPLIVAIPICPGYKDDDIIQACSKTPIHAVLLINRLEEYRNIIDSYEPFIKQLAIDYNIPYLLKSIIFEKDKLNKNYMLVKTEQGPNIYLVVGNKKTMIIDMPTYEVFKQDFKIISEEEMNSYEDGGTLIWADRIIK